MWRLILLYCLRPVPIIFLLPAYPHEFSEILRKMLYVLSCEPSCVVLYLNLPVFPFDDLFIRHGRILYTALQLFPARFFHLPDLTDGRIRRHFLLQLCRKVQHLHKKTLGIIPVFLLYVHAPAHKRIFFVDPYKAGGHRIIHMQSLLQVIVISIIGFRPQLLIQDAPQHISKLDCILRRPAHGNPDSLIQFFKAHFIDRDR